MSVLSDLIEKNIDMEEAVVKALKDDDVLSELLEGILSKQDEIRFNCHQVLMHLTEMQPEVLYPNWDYLTDLLDSDNHYHRYIAINLLANLVEADTEDMFEEIFDKYFGNIDGDRTMVAGQAALNAGKIARAKPNLQKKITDKLLNIEKTHRGKQVELIKAYAIEAFNEYFDEAVDKGKIIDFVKAQFESQSPKTRKVAKEFLKKWELF